MDGSLNVMDQPITFEQVVFKDCNSLKDGGTLYVDSLLSTLTLSSVLVENSKSTDFGGFMYVTASYTVIVNGDSKVSSCHAKRGGVFAFRSMAVTPTGKPNVDLNGVFLSKNIATHSGGVLFSDFSDLRLTSIKAEENAASRMGGALRLVSVTAHIEESYFRKMMPGLEEGVL